MAHWKQPPCAQRWMPRLSTMAPIWIPRGYMPDWSPSQKKEGYSAPIQPCCYFIRVVNLFQQFIPFVVFKCLWSLKHMERLDGVPPVWTGFCIWRLITEHRRCVFVWPQIYTDWANHYLAKSGHKRLIKDLQTDVTDGVLLAEIIQVVGKYTFDSKIWEENLADHTSLVTFERTTETSSCSFFRDILPDRVCVTQIYQTKTNYSYTLHPSTIESWLSQDKTLLYKSNLSCSSWLSDLKIWKEGIIRTVLVYSNI